MRRGWKIGALAWAFCWLLSAAGAHAREPEDGARCRAIADDTERLDCYDALYQAQPDTAEPPPGKAEPLPQRAESLSQRAKPPLQQAGPESLLSRVRRTSSAWLRHIRTPMANGETTVEISARSAERIACGDGRGERVRLVIRCQDDTTTLFLASHCLIDAEAGKQEVTWQVDEGPVRTVPMEPAPDQGGLGCWEADESVPLVKALFGATELHLGLESRGDQDRLLVFPIYNLEAAIGPLRRACDW